MKLTQFLKIAFTVFGISLGTVLILLGLVDLDNKYYLAAGLKSGIGALLFALAAYIQYRNYVINERNQTQWIFDNLNSIVAILALFAVLYSLGSCYDALFVATTPWQVIWNIIFGSFAGFLGIATLRDIFHPKKNKS